MRHKLQTPDTSRQRAVPKGGRPAILGRMASTEDFEALADVGDIPENGVLGVRKSTGERICLVNVGGRICALSDICSHQDFPLSEGHVLPTGELECVWHGARFDPCTGEARQLPARDPVPTHEVTIEDGRVFVGPRRGSGPAGR